MNECPGAKTESEERSCNANAGVPVPHMCPPCSPDVVQGCERNKATLMLRSPNEMPDAVSSVAVSHRCPPCRIRRIQMPCSVLLLTTDVVLGEDAELQMLNAISSVTVNH